MIRRLAAAVALGVVAAVAAAPSAALAHNSIVSSTPAEGETLTALPDRFEIVTSDALLDFEGADFVMQVRDAEDRYYGGGCVTVDGTSMSTPAALGAAGDYRLLYAFVSEDGHTVSGELAFSWQPPADFAPATGSPSPIGCDGAAPPAIAPDDSRGSPPGDWLWILGGLVTVFIAVSVTAIVAIGLRKPRP